MHETRSPKRVLIIEDYADSAQLLCVALQSHGHVVEVASTGTEGITKAQVLQPDVIICDLGLPDIDGLAVARAIRADDGLKGVRLIALTAYFVPAHAAAAGYDEYVTKPADLEKLAQLLEREPPRREAP